MVTSATCCAPSLSVQRRRAWPRWWSCPRRWGRPAHTRRPARPVSRPRHDRQLLLQARSSPAAAPRAASRPRADLLDQRRARPGAEPRRQQMPQHFDLGRLASARSCQAKAASCPSSMRAQDAHLLHQRRSPARLGQCSAPRTRCGRDGRRARSRLTPARAGARLRAPRSRAPRFRRDALRPRTRTPP